MNTTLEKSMAKPGRGGELPEKKVPPLVAELRELLKEAANNALSQNMPDAPVDDGSEHKE